MRLYRWSLYLQGGLLAGLLLLLSACGGSAGSGSSASSACNTLLPGAGQATAGTSFPQLPFPQGSVSTAVKQQSTGDGQFTISTVDVCSPNTSSGAVIALYNSMLPSEQWSQSKTFPFDGSFQDACGDSNCWDMDNATLYLKIENVTDKGNGLVTYDLRLATPPPAAACGANFTDPTYYTQLDAMFQSTTVYNAIPLPPLTRLYSDNASGLRGTILCSAGTTASITVFMTKHLSSLGWQQLSAVTGTCPPSMKYASPTCWQNGSYRLVWAINSPIDWLIVFHDPDVGG